MFCLQWVALLTDFTFDLVLALSTTQWNLILVFDLYYIFSYLVL